MGRVKFFNHGGAGRAAQRENWLLLFGTTTRGVSPATATYWTKPLRIVYLFIEDCCTGYNCWCSFRKVARDDASIAPSQDHTPFVCLPIRLTTGHSKSVPRQWSDQCRAAQPARNQASARGRQRQIKSSWLRHDREFILCEEWQPPCHPLREVWTAYGRA